MKTYTQKPENKTRTLDAHPSASRQPPLSEILQAYRSGTFEYDPIQRESTANENQLKMTGSSPVIQRRLIRSEFHGDFYSEELDREEILAIFKQLIQISANSDTIENLAAAIKHNEFNGDPIDLDSIDEWNPYKPVTIEYKDCPLEDMITFPQEQFYAMSPLDLSIIWEQLIAIDPNTLNDEWMGHWMELKSKVHNGREMGKHMEETENGWFEIYGYSPGEGTVLHDLVYQVVVEAIGDRKAIGEMSYDEIYGYTPETQLAYCLKDCRDKEEDILALCLYTSYFFEPLNKYFRGQIEPNESTSFGQLILRTATVLGESYNAEEETVIEDRRYRLELKSGWITDDQELIDFRALTSTHPSLDGVKNMWGDIAEGTFGEFDNFALLTFEGTAKIKRPEKKYFEGESEDLMGPGSQYVVIDRYLITGNIPNIGETPIRVFRLSNSAPPYPQADRLTFADVVS